MSYEQDEIRQTLAKVSNNITLLDMLLEFEKTIDNANIYAYQNWINGELVQGPEVSRYWFETTWMYPYKMMPDPNGAVRLEKFGCKVYYEKDDYLEPVEINGREDYINIETKQAKEKKCPVWLITIVMPRKFIDERVIDDIEFSDQEIEVDVDDVAAAYEEDMDGVTDADVDTSLEEPGAEEGF